MVLARGKAIWNVEAPNAIHTVTSFSGDPRPAKNDPKALYSQIQPSSATHSGEETLLKCIAIVLHHRLSQLCQFIIVRHQYVVPFLLCCVNTSVATIASNFLMPITTPLATRYSASASLEIGQNEIKANTTSAQDHGGTVCALKHIPVGILEGGPKEPRDQHFSEHCRRTNPAKLRAMIATKLRKPDV